MRVRVAYSIDVDDGMRREINAFYGKPGLANRQEVRDWYRAYGESMNDDLIWSAQERAEREEGVTD